MAAAAGAVVSEIQNLNLDDAIYLVNVGIYLIPALLVLAIGYYVLWYRIIEVSIYIWENYLFPLLKEIWAWVVKAVKDAWKWIKGAFNYALAKTEYFWGYLHDKGELLYGKVKAETIKLVDEGIYIAGIVEKEIVKGVEYLKEKFLGFIDSVKNFYNSAVSAVSSFASSVFNVVKGLIESAVNIATNVFGFFEGFFSDVGSFFSGIGNFITKSISYLLDLPGNIIDGIGSAISSLVPAWL